CEVNTRNSAVIDNSKFQIQNFQYDSTSQIQLKELNPKRIVYESSSATDGLAVFSEIYYPNGWQATIDSKEVPILRADYILRALEVPAGRHEIVFEFKPRPYVIGNKITMASSWLLLLVVAGSLGLTFRKK
ncbi:MAG TPA: YfhO family protein, partial [Cyclobacteriaceae bacterium]